MQTLITRLLNPSTVRNGAQAGRNSDLTKLCSNSASHQPFPSRNPPTVRISYVVHDGDGPGGCDPDLAQDLAEFSHIRHEGVRNRALATRRRLRTTLSECTGKDIPREAWDFGRDSMGKPFVKSGVRGGPQPFFNCSHTAHVSVIAASLDTPVGIDIEAAEVSADPDFLAMFLSPRERRILASLDAAQRARTVSRLWTLKECYAKLVGTGLALDFTELDFSSGALLSSPTETLVGSDVELSGWTLDLKGVSFSVALAVQSA